MKHLDWQKSAFTSGIATVAVILVYGLLKWIGVEAGNFLDWLIGLASIWWFSLMITIPWNLYFRARGITDEMKRSLDRGLAVDTKQRRYVKRLTRIAILVALSLHFWSGIGLFAISYFGISPVGYVSGCAALLLTGLRPSINLYHYLNKKLSTIGREIHIPRDDAIALREEVAQMQHEVSYLVQRLDLTRHGSWASQVEDNIHELDQTLERRCRELSERIDKLERSLEAHKRQNQIEHERIEHSAESLTARLAEDTAFLGHARELIRFIKSA